MAAWHYGLGWDVAGWASGTQQFALVAYNGAHFRWVGQAECALKGAPPFAPVRDTLLELCHAAEINAAHVPLAVDAPLGYPLAFRQTVNNAPSGTATAEAATFRRAELYLGERFGKRPLSGVLGWLAGPAVLANQVVKAPQFERHFAAALEVYPGLFAAAKQHSALRQFLEAALFTEGLPEAVKGYLQDVYMAGAAKSSYRDRSVLTDQGDAVLCACMAAVYAAQRVSEPPFWLVGPEADLPHAALLRQEGWIYFPAILPGP